MKKFLILGIMVLFLGSLIALESGPSETVGFFKIGVPAGYTAFSVPLKVYVGGVETLALSDILGDQLTGGMAFNSDKVWDITAGTFAWYNTGTSTWVGFTDFIDGHAYYVENKHAAIDLYLSGTVVEEACDYGTMAVGYNAFSVNSAKEISLDDLDLLSSGFTGGMAFNSDKIWDITAGTFAWYNTGTSTWVGFTTVTPTHSYYVENKHTAFAWVYDPLSREDGKYFTPVYKPAVEKNITPKLGNKVAQDNVPRKMIKKNVKK